MEYGTPLVAVAFDMRLGKEAASEGVVLDVDHEVLQKALIQGGMTPEQCLEYLVIIDMAKNSGTSGRADFRGRSPDNAGRPAIRIHAESCTGKLSAEIATHEARHLSDYLDGNNYRLGDQARRLRKAAAVAGGLMIGACYGYDATAFGASDILTGAAVMIGGDICVVSALFGEYRTRKIERRAYHAQRTAPSSSIMAVQPRDGSSEVQTPPPRKLKSIRKGLAVGLRAIFLPDFSL